MYMHTHVYPDQLGGGGCNSAKMDAALTQQFPRGENIHYPEFSFQIISQIKWMRLQCEL